MKLSNTTIIKKNLDGFKTSLANMELKKTKPENRWRLAFWENINGQVPQIMKFEKDNAVFDSGYLSHKWHSFPAKFYPQFVRVFMNLYNIKKTDTVYDPYAGCGTSAVESKVMGMNYVGIDISKLAVLISKSKTSLDINIIQVEVMKNKIIKKFKSMEKNTWTYTEFEIYWYNKFNRPQIQLLNYLIKDIQDIQIKEFFQVALSSILRRVANTKSGQIEARHEYRKTKIDVIRLFSTKIDSMLNDIKIYQNEGKTKCNIKLENANASSYLPDEQVDFIITSPPYGNGLDYAKIHQLSINLFYGTDEVTKFKKSQTGTLNGSNSKIYDTPFTVTGTDVISKLEKNNLSKAKSMSKYYTDMRNSIQNMYSALHSKGYAVIVIGKTRIKDLIINNDTVLSEIGEDVGFNIDKRIQWKYDKTRRSGLEHKIKGESIIIFRKT